ncbi:MAG: hypothetical protein VXZ96_04850 [Myxococcota bacterium]|nr:hypothetical protein [Myxococcota bacterium]
MYYLHENSEDRNLIHHRDGEVHGKTLREIIEGKPLPMSVCFEVLAYVADILTETDKIKLYHGHLCLDTVGIDPSGAVYIVDYDQGKTESKISPETRLTDISSDTYALGLLLIALLAGHDNYKIPKDERHHDDAIARIILSLSWQELSGQTWLENIQDFLVDTLSYFQSERPHPLDVANVLFELLPFTDGPRLKAFASERIQPPSQNKSDVVAQSKPMEEWGAAESIEAPVLRSVSIVPDSSQGAATGLWSRQKIANMFNGSLKPEEKARREVWKPKQFGEEQELSDAFLASNLPPAQDTPPPPPLPDLPDLPPLLGGDEPNPIDNPDFFITSQASLSTPEPFGRIENTPNNDIPPPPSFMAPPGPDLPSEPAPLPNRPHHVHPDTAPLSSALEGQFQQNQETAKAPPAANISVSQSSPSIGVNVHLGSTQSPPKTATNTKRLFLIGLTICMVMCIGIVGTMYRNKDFLLSQINPATTQPSAEVNPKDVEQSPPDDIISEPEAVEPVETNEQPTPSDPPPEPVPTPTPQPSTNTSGSASRSTQGTAATPPPIPRTPRREVRPARPPTAAPAPAPTPPPEPTPTAPPTPEPAQVDGPIRATITGVSGRVSCGDGQQMEINNSIVMEFSSQQACRIDSSDGLRGAIIVTETKTYSCISNNGAIECR